MSIKQAIEALEKAVARMDRARDILTDGKPTIQCNWGMLDTSDLSPALAALRSMPTTLGKGITRDDTVHGEEYFTRDQVEAVRSMPAEPVATIRYERGTPGKENDMPKVVSCNWLPDGVYSVYATPQTEAVRMSEAEILALWTGSDIAVRPALGSRKVIAFARAVEQAKAARLGVKMGDATQPAQPPDTSGTDPRPPRA